MLAVGLGCDGDAARSEHPERTHTPSPHAPDNTASNERDRDADAKTPFSQQENQADLDITASIRRGVMAEPGFSLNAHNVKIVSADAVVTLRGVVDQASEKSRIGELSRATPGVKSVDNQLEVTPPR